MKITDELVARVAEDVPHLLSLVTAEGDREAIRAVLEGGAFAATSAKFREAADVFEKSAANIREMGYGPETPQEAEVMAIKFMRDFADGIDLYSPEP